MYDFAGSAFSCAPAISKRQGPTERSGLMQIPPRDLRPPRTVRRQRGSLTVATKPPSGLFSRDMSPPCARIALLAIASPRPAPPVSRLREVSYRWNGSKTASSWSSGNPGPWSVMWIRTYSPLSVSSILARSPYRMALSIKFRRARFSITGRR